jgi:hypothetical protein
MLNYIKVERSEQDQQVTVRLLPDGAAHGALLSGLNGQFLRIDLSPIPLKQV